MEKLHERCIRFIYNDYDKGYFNILSENKSTTLFGKRMLKMCCEIFETKNGLNAAYMIHILEERPSKYPSRNTNILYVPCLGQSAAKGYCMLITHALSSKPRTSTLYLRNSIRNLINSVTVCRQQTKHSFCGW